jgi:hypothetical protein
MNIFRVFLAVVLALVSVEVLASNGTQTSVTITAVQEGTSSSTTPFFVIFTNANSTPASCATSTKQFAVDPTTTGGQELIKLITTIYGLGKTATFTGLGTCNVSSGTEDLGSILTTD